MTSIVRTPDGHGYWIVGTDGGVFTFGDAGFYGSLPGINVTPSPARVADSVAFHAYASSQDVFLAPTPDAGGYWVVDSAGDVYGFGDAGFYGSLPGRLSSLAKTSAHDVVTGHQATVPVTGFAPTADGRGYWMVATDGSLYTFGDAPNYGSLRDIGLTPPPVTVNGYYPPSTVGLSIPLANVSAFVRTPDGGLLVHLAQWWGLQLRRRPVPRLGSGCALDHRQCQRTRLAVAGANESKVNPDEFVATTASATLPATLGV